MAFGASFAFLCWRCRAMWFSPSPLHCMVWSFVFFPPLNWAPLFPPLLFVRPNTDSSLSDFFLSFFSNTQTPCVCERGSPAGRTIFPPLLPRLLLVSFPPLFPFFESIPFFLSSDHTATSKCLSDVNPLFPSPFSFPGSFMFPVVEGCTPPPQLP